MPHIPIPEGVPGILGPLGFRPETAKPLLELADVLLRGESTLTPGERELIATRVSHGNECHFCERSHGAVAAYHLDGDTRTVDAVRADPETADVSPKLRALLAIADRVRDDARTVGDDDVARAREERATDREIHDTVLIAAAFCMYNRYVDGLATWAPDDEAAYAAMGERLATAGYRSDAPR
jgi:uncharacterized peroxidase-related enzyme